jgi:hypothetical protein
LREYVPLLFLGHLLQKKIRIFEYSPISCPMKKAFFICSLFSFYSTVFFSQTQVLSYPEVGKGVATTFVTDYHCLGINTSSLGWGTGYDGKKVTMGSSEFAFGIYSDALNSTKMNKFTTGIKNQILKKGTPMSGEEQKEAVADYALAGVSLFFDYNWGGFSYQSKRFGGIALHVRESYQYYSKFNQATTDLIFRGNVSSLFDSLTVVFGSDTSRIENRPDVSSDTLNNTILGTLNVPLNLSQLTLGSTVKTVWNRSYNFGYGRKVFGKDSLFVLYAGVGGRYIQSMAMFNLESKEDGLYMYSSISPTFNIDYGAIANSNPAANKGVLGKLPSAVGDGYGLDLSASAIFFAKLKVAMSVNNVGRVTYKRNVYRVKDTLFTSLSVNGLENYDITQSLNQLLSEGGILQVMGEDQYVLKNAANFRCGASFQAGKKLHFGLDIVAPFHRDNPGSIQNPIVSFGGEVRPFKWIALSAGYLTGGYFGGNIPVGVNFIFGKGKYECGISSRDAVSFFTKNGNSFSSAFGFARFRF